MKRVLRSIFLLSNILAFILIFSCDKKENEEKMLPSELSEEVSDSLIEHFKKGEISNQEQFNSYRDMFAKEMLHKSRTEADSLSEEELLEYGNLLHWAGKHKKAKGVFGGLSTGEGAQARNASRYLITIEIDSKNYDCAEELITDFRKRFPVIPEMPANLYEPVQDLAGRYSDIGRPRDAAELIIGEINSLKSDAPYPSYYLLKELLSIMIELRRVSECLDLVDYNKSSFQKSLEAHVDTTVYSDTLKIEDNSVVKDYKALIKYYESAINQLNLVGNKAPPINFLHAYNVDSTFAFSDIEGQVTIIEFWTTWCVPCVVGFTEMRKLYDEFKDQGLQIVGVTNLNGSFPGVETEKIEDGKSKKLSKEREIELTASYIKEHNILWPCVVSEQSVIGAEYSITNIPAYVIIDRDMKVRFIHSCIGAYHQMRRVVSKLLK